MYIHTVIHTVECNPDMSLETFKVVVAVAVNRKPCNMIGHPFTRW